MEGNPAEFGNGIEAIIYTGFFSIMLIILNSYFTAAILYPVNIPFWTKIKNKLQRKNLVKFTLFLIVAAIFWFLFLQGSLDRDKVIFLMLYFILTATYLLHKRLLWFRWPPWQRLLFKTGSLSRPLAVFAALIVTAIPIIFIYLLIMET